jgi:hypothetical protein
MATTEPAGSMSVDHINGLVNQGGCLCSFERRVLTSRQQATAAEQRVKHSKKEFIGIPLMLTGPHLAYIGSSSESSQMT